MMDDNMAGEKWFPCPHCGVMVIQNPGTNGILVPHIHRSVA